MPDCVVVKFTNCGACFRHLQPPSLSFLNKRPNKNRLFRHKQLLFCLFLQTGYTFHLFIINIYSYFDILSMDFKYIFCTINGYIIPDIYSNIYNNSNCMLSYISIASVYRKHTVSADVICAIAALKPLAVGASASEAFALRRRRPLKRSDLARKNFLRF